MFPLQNTSQMMPVERIPRQLAVTPSVVWFAVTVDALRWLVPSHHVTDR